MKNNFYSNRQLKKLGFDKIGTNNQVSLSSKFYAFSGEIGNNSRIDDYSIFKGKISFGSNVHVSSFCYFASVGSEIIIRDLTGISSMVSIYSVTDNFLYEGLTNPTVSEKFRHVIRGKVDIGSNVSIGAHCLILPNVKIGDSCAIGAKSLVNKNLKIGEILLTK